MNIQEVTPRAMQALVKHSWPGNIRELRNVIERGMLFCDEACLDLPHLPPELLIK
jgi:transcriptional regulator with PAS, ATPase and Fis domain